MDVPVGVKTDSTGKERKLTMMKVYDEKLKECREAAARAEKEPETLNRLVKELLDIQSKILASR